MLEFSASGDPLRVWHTAGHSSCGFARSVAGVGDYTVTHPEKD